jgi:two-component system chemotaxis response regulator CheY
VRDLGKVRVLIVGWKPNTNQFLRIVLASLGLPAFTRVSRTDEALTLMRDHGFEVVFCTGEAEPLNPSAFTRAVRHDVLSRDPTIPVFIVMSGCTLNEIELMRDAGADDIFCPPMSADAIDKRLERVLLKSRRFVTTKGFIGPDRRRAGDREFRSQDRRVSQGVIFCQPPRIKRD